MKKISMFMIVIMYLSTMFAYADQAINIYSDITHDFYLDGAKIGKTKANNTITINNIPVGAHTVSFYSAGQMAEAGINFDSQNHQYAFNTTQAAFAGMRANIAKDDIEIIRTATEHFFVFENQDTNITLLWSNTKEARNKKENDKTTYGCLLWGTIFAVVITTLAYIVKYSNSTRYNY